MNYIKHLTGFFDKVAQDKLLNPTHVSLYIALFQFWNINRFRNPISISRGEVMRISKISSLATYHKVLKNLDAHGYIKYVPSFNPYKGSHVYLFNFADDLKPTARNERTANSNFEQVNEQVLNKHCTSIETGTEQVGEQALVRYINNTNSTNKLNSKKGLNDDQPTKNNIESDIDLKIEERLPKEKSSAKKEKVTRELISINPLYDEVLKYFTEKNIPETEASKFYNYNNSIGWIIGGKSPITDWKSAANNWILKIPNFSHTEKPNTTRTFDTSPNKDYSEPL